MDLYQSFTPTAQQLAFIERHADAGEEYYQRLRDSIKEHDNSMTERQRSALTRAMEEEKNRPRLNGKPVMNRKLRDKRVVCRDCPKLATKVDGNYGVCDGCFEQRQASKAS